MSLPTPSKTSLKWPWFVLVTVGCLLWFGGVWMLFTDSAAEDYKRAVALPHHQVKELPSVAANASLLLEGQLASLTPPGPHGFIIYRLERFVRKPTSGATAGKEEWRTVSTTTPKVALKQGDALVLVTNTDYSMTNWPHSWKSHVVPRYRSISDYSQRILGFKEGAQVIVDGRLVGSPATGAPQMRVTTIASGDRQSYLEGLRGGIMALKIIGAVFAGFGLLLLGGALLWRRAVRRAAQPHLHD